jgi:hypothetical protein
LRTLQAARAAVINLAEDLKTHGLTEHPDPLSTSTTVLLDQNVEELFVPYLQDRGYMDRERESLEQLYSSLLLKFTMFHVCRLQELEHAFHTNPGVGATEESSELGCSGPIQENERKGDWEGT